MADSYNVDDILKEVKKRREENEQEIIAKNDEVETTQEEIVEEFTEEAEEIAEEPEKEAIEEATKAEAIDPDGEVNLFDIIEQEDEKPQKNAKKHTKNDKKAQNHTEKVKFRKTKKGKIVISIICVLLALIIGLAVFGIGYADKLLNMVTGKNSDEPPVKGTEMWQGMDELKEQFDPINEAPKSEISNLSDMARTWYYTGKPVSSTHVLNVLLIGEDTRGSEIVDEGFRADSAIVASINKDTGKIILTSILRDTYVYYELEEGNKESGKFSKINEAMSYGGLDCYIRAVENNYKINIDNYVLVNFESFKTIIDTLGGVDVPMTTKEIKEINSHQGRYGGVTIKKSFDGNEGTMHLNGEQALAFCRIRYIDSDGARANRQKIVLGVILEKARQSSTLKAAELVTKFLPYVRTGATKQEVIDLATYALKNGWINYNVETYNVPENFLDENGAEVKLAIGGSYKGAWMWRADLPLASQITQQRIYGKTAVVLNENRPKFGSLA